MYQINLISTPISGCSYDDNCGINVLCVLATTKHILHRDDVLSSRKHSSIYTGNLSRHLLAGDEQLDVQSDYLLYLFRSVSEKIYFYLIIWCNSSRDWREDVCWVLWFVWLIAFKEFFFSYSRDKNLFMTGILRDFVHVRLCKSLFVI